MKFKDILYFSFFTTLPFLLWVNTNVTINKVTFIIVIIILILSKYTIKLKPLHHTLEIIVLFNVLEYLSLEIGLHSLFPFNHALTLLVLFIFLLRFKKISRDDLFLRKGVIKHSVGISVFFAILSIIAVSVWFILYRENPYASFVPDASTVILICLGIGFSLINGIYEESIFRSILLSHFSNFMGFSAALILQAIWFSFLHYQAGFPSGVLGILLTFIFGIIMGYLVKRTRGLMLSILVHVVVDFAVFMLVLLRMQNLI